MKTKEAVIFGLITIITAIVVCLAWAIWFAGNDWFYSHIGIIVLGTLVAVALTAIATIIMQSHPSAKALTATALITATLATSAQAGVFTPASGDSPNSSPKGSYWSWLMHGWNFLSWSNIWDGYESWSSGAPTITIDPNQPSNNDASGK